MAALLRHLQGIITINAVAINICMFLNLAVCAGPVEIGGGLIQGTVEEGLPVYRGIPYAAPPTGDLRWRVPQPVSKWNGVRTADQFGRACIQSNPAIADLPEPGEDCLYLSKALLIVSKYL